MTKIKVTVEKPKIPEVREVSVWTRLDKWLVVLLILSLFSCMIMIQKEFMSSPQPIQSVVIQSSSTPNLDFIPIPTVGVWVPTVIAPIKYVNPKPTPGLTQVNPITVPSPICLKFTNNQQVCGN